MRALRTVGLGIAALLLLPAASYGAVTIGSNLTATPTTNRCAAGIACTYAQVAPLPNDTASGGLTSPIDGVVTRWRIKSGSAGGPVKLRVLRPTGGGAFTGAGTSQTEATTSGTANFTTRLPIRRGDYLGVDNQNSALIFATTPGASIYYWQPALADGANLGATGTLGPLELMVQADVEPDVDCDGLGDETQDPNTSDGPCAQQPGGGGTGADRTPPVLASLSMKPATWAVRRSGPAEVRIARTRVKRGTTLRYTLTKAARVVFAVERKERGRRVNGVCRKQTRSNRTKPRCTRYVFAGAFAQQAVAGANTKRFSGRIGSRALKPGRYRVTLVATDAAANTSLPRRLSFRVVRG